MWGENLRLYICVCVCFVRVCETLKEIDLADGEGPQRSAEGLFVKVSGPCCCETRWPAVSFCMSVCACCWIHECTCKLLGFCAYVLLCLCALKPLCASVHVSLVCVCVCVQDPGRAAQQALGGRCQINRTRPSSARSGRHPRLCRLHHGVRRQRAPAGAQSGAGIAWHPWQVRTTLPPLSIISLFFPSVRLL